MSNCTQSIEDKLFFSLHSIKTLGLRVTCLPTNQFLNYIWDSEAPDKWEQFKNFNQGAHYSPAFGFTLDIEPVKSQVSVLKNIYKEYVPGLETGTLDLAKADEFFAKLKANGLDEVIQEKQRQLDEFLASKK